MLATLRSVEDPAQGSQVLWALARPRACATSRQWRQCVVATFVGPRLWALAPAFQHACHGPLTAGQTPTGRPCWVLLTYGCPSIESAEVEEAMKDGAVQLDAILEICSRVGAGLLGARGLQHSNIITAMKGSQLVVLGTAWTLREVWVGGNLRLDGLDGRLGCCPHAYMPSLRRSIIPYALT